MQLFRYYSPFVKRTGMLNAIECFVALSIVPCGNSGTFSRNRVNELIGFCKTHPDFHIVSYLNPNVIVNRLAVGAHMFFLGDGDSNPHLIYDTTIKDEDLEIFELRTAQTTA